MEMIRNYIGGKLVPSVSGKTIENVDPSCGKVYSLIADSDTGDVESAVAAATMAFDQWSTTSAEVRSSILMRIGQLIERETETLAYAETVDSGKPIQLARSVDIPRAASNFRFFASSLMHFASESHAMENIAINYTLRSPIGVVGCISPWNLPLYLLTWKVAPALAAGNCVVAKPSELTPMTAYKLSLLCIEAGLPAGVLNIVQGFGAKAGHAIVSHPSVSAISFTGGTATGRSIAQTSAPMFKKLSLEMGGKNPTIIFADCDYDEMLRTTIRSSFSNQGEICLCGSRIYVERPLYERFKTDFVRKAQRLTVGDPLDEMTDLGAIVSKGHLEKILSYVTLGVKEGGTILCGGKQINLAGRTNNGWFISPAVIEGLPVGCRTNREEIFGPVVTIAPFDQEDEVVSHANGTEYGLAAIVWTKDLTRAHRIAASIQSGIVWVNCWMLRDLRTPFGGMKNSGLGREGGLEALRFFTEPKNICIRL